MKKQYNGTWESLNSHEVPAWYHDCKFGIFIHWGLYSVPAYAPITWQLGEVPIDENWYANNPYAEWYFNSVNVGRGPTYEHHIKTYGIDFKYEDFVSMWKVDNYKPDKWAELFRKAGAAYVVMVTKHHDGFCLFPSKYTDYNAMKKGPKRDLVGDLTNAVRAQGMKMGLYYSGILDWRFAHDPIIEQNDNFNKACPTYEYADYAYNQSCELIDNYKPSVFWNDIGWPKQGEQNLPYLLSHYYNNVEEGVVNDRFNGLYHDFRTMEYKYGESNRMEKWEMNRGMGLSFGYNAIEEDDKIMSVEDTISLLVSTVSNNGNLLLNIGPKADGTIPKEQEKRLLSIGQWLAVNGEAIYGTRCSKRESAIDESGVQIHYTKKKKDLYVMLDKVPQGAFEVVIPDLSGEIRALDDKIFYDFEAFGTGVKIKIHSHQTSIGSIAFKVPGGE